MQLIENTHLVQQMFHFKSSHTDQDTVRVFLCFLSVTWGFKRKWMWSSSLFSCLWPVSGTLRLHYAGKEEGNKETRKQVVVSVRGLWAPHYYHGMGFYRRWSLWWVSLWSGHQDPKRRLPGGIRPLFRKKCTCHSLKVGFKLRTDNQSFLSRSRR